MAFFISVLLGGMPQPHKKKKNKKIKKVKKIEKRRTRNKKRKTKRLEGRFEAFLLLVYI